MIELRRLRAFVTVVEEGNITRAAERPGSFVAESAAAAQP